MRTFGRVETSIWQNWRFHQLSDDEKLLFMYFVSQPCGAVIFNQARSDLRWSNERTSTAFNGLQLRRIARSERGEIHILETFGCKPARTLPIGRLAWSAWSKIRSIVFDRDGERCAYCGDINGPFEIDHIVARARGGTDDPDNLTVACRTCNRSKHAKSLDQWMPC